MPDTILKNVRVIGATWVWAGPWMGSVLADMGAEVIKIESEQQIDNMRHMMGMPVSDSKLSYNRSAFNVLNRGQKSCTINLKKADGVKLFKELVKISDVVIENFPPRVMHEFGLDYNTLKEVKKDIIMVSLSGFGQTGPDKDYLAYASTVGAIGGYISSFGYPDHGPALDGTSIADPIGSMYGVVSTLSALYHRKKTGKGQHVDISELEALITVLPEMIMEFTMNKRKRKRSGNRDAMMAPHGCYPCKGNDKWIAIAVSNDEEWQALCRIMGSPEWAKEEKFADKFKRWKNQDLIDEHLKEWTKKYRPYEIMRMLQDEGIAAGPSFNIEELINDEHVRTRGAIFEQDHLEAGKTTVFRSPWISAETFNNPPAPCLGQHNSYVFNKLLGLSESEIEVLIDKKVIY